MGTLNDTASAAKTTVIVCSDHSWRRADMAVNSALEQGRGDCEPGPFRPSSGPDDPLPRAASEHEVTAPFDEIGIHDIIEHLLRGQEPGFDKALLAGGADFPVAARP